MLQAAAQLPLMRSEFPGETQEDLIPSGFKGQDGPPEMAEEPLTPQTWSGMTLAALCPASPLPLQLLMKWVLSFSLFYRWGNQGRWGETACQVMLRADEQWSKDLAARSHLS